MTCSWQRRFGEPCRSPCGSCGSAVSKSFRRSYARYGEHRRAQTLGWRVGLTLRRRRECLDFFEGVSMGRSVIVMSLLLGGAVTACSSFRDLFSAHADVAAEAGGQRLTPERLAQIMNSGKGIRPSLDAASFVANVWIDY